MADVSGADVIQVPVHPGELFRRIYGKLKPELDNQTELGQLLVVAPAAKGIGEGRLPVAKGQRRFSTQVTELDIEVFGLILLEMDNKINHLAYLKLQIVPVNHSVAQRPAHATSIHTGSSNRIHEWLNGQHTAAGIPSILT